MLIPNHGANSFLNCGSDASAALKLTINGNNIEGKSAGHYLSQFRLMVKPLAKN
jgi:hypothetical protein